MANARYSSTKGNQRNSDACYEGEQGLAGMGQMSDLGSAKSRDTVGSFGSKEMVNEMKGSGAPTSKQAKYSVPTDNWRG